MSTVRVDNKRRVVLPKGVALADFYAVEVTENQEIILRPRALVDPRETISKKTLEVLNESMTHLLDGRAGPPINLSAFDSDTHGKAKAKTAAGRTRRKRA